MNAPTPRRPEACVSDLAFDRFLTGEASEASSEALRQHVQGCERCSSRLQALQAEQRAFAADAPPRVPPGRRHRALVTLSSVFLAAAAALLVFLPDPAGIRTKGGMRLDFFVKRGESVFEAGDEAQLQPGDVLRFRYSAPRAGWLAVLNVDVVHNVSVFFPVYDRMAEVPAASQELLPGATELDRSLGAERLVGVFCSAEQPLPQLVDLLQENPDAAAPSSCAFETLHIHKRAP
jgi:hypothetical protein